MNLQARLYDPVIGRFLSVDPLAEIQLGITPYHYCGNDPVNAKDPSGLFQDEVLLKQKSERESSFRNELSASIYKTNSEFWYGFNMNFLNSIGMSIDRYADLANGGKNQIYTALFAVYSYYGQGGTVRSVDKVFITNYEGIAHQKGNGQDCLITQMVSLCKQAGIDIGYESITSVLDKRNINWKSTGTNVYDIMLAVTYYYPKTEWGFMKELNSDAIIEQLNNNHPLLGGTSIDHNGQNMGHGVTITGYDSNNGFTYFDGNTNSYGTTKDLNFFTPLYTTKNGTNVYFIYIIK